MQTLDKTVSILLVEDELLWQQGITTLLSLEGDRFKLVAVSDNYDDGLAQFKQHCPDIVLLDWKLAGDKDGLELGLALEGLGLNPKQIVLVSGSLPDSIPANNYYYVAKPQIASDLVGTIDMALSNRQKASDAVLV